MTMHEAVDTSAISFRGLSKSFADAAVLHGIELDVPAGRTFGLVGINGAGKIVLAKDSTKARWRHNPRLLTRGGFVA